MLWVVIVWLCLIEFGGDSATRKEKAWIQLFPSTALKHLEVHSSNCESHITHNNFGHCCVSFFSFVRQPYSKQLYITDQMQCDMCPEKRNVVVTECFSQLALRDEPNKTPQLMCGLEPWTFQKIRKVFGSSNFAPTIVKIKFTLSTERFPKSSRLQILHQLTAYEHSQRAATN